MPIAEAMHEMGRSGALRAKILLQQLLGDGIDLSFNAYDHPKHLEFVDPVPNGNDDATRFQFDLGGTLRRRNPGKFDGKEATAVFVEVKSRDSAGNLLDDYRDFLRRAAIASNDERHRESWFIFYSTVPFGSSYGSAMVDGTLLGECAKSWHMSLQGSADQLNQRVALVIATDSFVRLFTSWGRNAA